MNIIILGPQGSGKGTIAKQIMKDYNIPQVATGDILRDNIKRATPLGKIAESYVNNGSLIPIDLIIKVIKKRLLEKDCKSGYILDGFPRTMEQAVELDKITKIDAVIALEVPFDVIIKRILTRRVCSSCGEIYNTSSYSETTCKKCGSPLLQRDDDKSESAIRNRLEVYDRQTTPLINFYSDRIYKLDGNGSPDQVYSRVKTFLDKLEAKK